MLFPFNNASNIILTASIKSHTKLRLRGGSIAESSASLDYGAERLHLEDKYQTLSFEAHGIKFVDAKMSSSVKLISTVSEFVKERAEMEREHARKLAAMAKKYLPKVTTKPKDKHATHSRKKENDFEDVSSRNESWERMLLQCLEESHFHENYAGIMS
jgi:Fes/CIP4, and EFC/F-BAR homology domain